MWPQDARHDPFYRYLQQRYDIPQREAIVAAASHLARPEDLQAAAALGVPGAGLGGADGEGRGTTPVPGGGPLPRVSPITLVQVSCKGGRCLTQIRPAGSGHLGIGKSMPRHSCTGTVHAPLSCMPPSA